MHRPDDDDRPFPIRNYTKAELAMLYCPGECVTNALNNFSRWMRLNRPLTAELRKIGYNKYRHRYLPREVALIVKYMGEPGE